jgi:hypothetical protein
MNILRCTQEMNEREHCADGRSDSKNPSSKNKCGVHGSYPERNGKDQENYKSHPFEWAASFCSDVRLVATGGAYPPFPNTKWQDWNPKDVPEIQGTNLNGATRLIAVEAVVVAKG